MIAAVLIIGIILALLGVAQWMNHRELVRLAKDQVEIFAKVGIASGRIDGLEARRSTVTQATPFRAKEDAEVVEKLTRTPKGWSEVQARAERSAE